MVTAADRAAATFAALGDEPLRPPVAGTSPFRGGFAGSAAKRLPPQRELSAVRLTEDKPFCWGVRCRNGGFIFHHSLREWSPSFCGRRQGVAAKPPQVTVSRLSGTTKGLCDRPLETFARPLPVIGRYPTLAGHGGSVSRRDHNQAYRRPRPPLRRNQIRRTPHPKRQPLFGRRGLGRRGFSQRSRLLPRISPQTSFREGARGRVLFYQKSTLPRNHTYIIFPASRRR